MYKKKYLKYKKKYLELKNNQIGGYNLSDNTEGYMLNYTLTNILKSPQNNKHFYFGTEEGIKKKKKF